MLMRAGRRSVALLLVAFLTPAVVRGIDKTTPEYLREEHAGTVALESADEPAVLYPKLLKATTDCWVGSTKLQAPAGTGGALGGAAAVLTQATRVVLGDIAPDSTNAYIVVQARSGMRLMQSNFLQIDLMQDAAGGSRVTVFHKSNLKAHRQFIDEVRQWLSGDLGFCTWKPGMQRKRP